MCLIYTHILFGIWWFMHKSREIWYRSIMRNFLLCTYDMWSIIHVLEYILCKKYCLYMVCLQYPQFSLIFWDTYCSCTHASLKTSSVSCTSFVRRIVGSVIGRKTLTFLSIVLVFNQWESYDNVSIISVIWIPIIAIPIFESPPI